MSRSVPWWPCSNWQSRGGASPCRRVGHTRGGPWFIVAGSGKVGKRDSTRGAETVANELGPPPEMPDEQGAQNRDGNQDSRKQAADRTAESGACLGPLGQDLTQPASLGLAS